MNKNKKRGKGRGGGGEEGEKIRRRNETPRNDSFEYKNPLDLLKLHKTKSKIFVASYMLFYWSVDSN